MTDAVAFAVFVMMAIAVIWASVNQTALPTAMENSAEMMVAEMCVVPATRVNSVKMECVRQSAHLLVTERHAGTMVVEGFAEHVSLARYAVFPANAWVQVVRQIVLEKNAEMMAAGEVVAPVNLDFHVTTVFAVAIHPRTPVA